MQVSIGYNNGLYLSPRWYLKTTIEVPISSSVHNGSCRAGCVRGCIASARLMPVHLASRAAPIQAASAKYGFLAAHPDNVTHYATRARALAVTTRLGSYCLKMLLGSLITKKRYRTWTCRSAAVQITYFYTEVITPFACVSCWLCMWVLN